MFKRDTDLPLPKGLPLFVVVHSDETYCRRVACQNTLYSG